MGDARCEQLSLFITKCTNS